MKPAFAKIGAIMSDIFSKPRETLEKFFTWFGDQIDWAVHKIGELLGLDLGGFSIKDVFVSKRRDGEPTGENGMGSSVSNAVGSAVKGAGEIWDKITPKLQWLRNHHIPGIRNTRPGESSHDAWPQFSPFGPAHYKRFRKDDDFKNTPPSEHPGFQATFNNTFNIDADGLKGDQAKELIGAEVEKRQRTNLQNWGDLSRRKITA
jgi:hypothetical protein